METDDQLLQRTLDELRKRVETLSTSMGTVSLDVPDVSVHEIDKPTPIVSAASPIMDRRDHAGASRPDQRAIYPHAFDKELERGAAWFELESALKSLDECSAAYTEGDIEGVAFRLSESSLGFKAALLRLDSSDPLFALVSFFRRALIAAAPSDVSREALESARSIARSILREPIISLSEAADYSDVLESSGWVGDDQIVSSLMRDLLDETRADTQSYRLVEGVDE